MTARREPLLWLQLLALGALPLELLLILLVLAGSDPGPLPVLERLLSWGLGGLLPALVLWRYPADPLSLLLLQVPEGLRSAEQKGLSSSRPSLAAKLYLLTGSAILLPLFWWLDGQSSLASELAPLGSGHRLFSLLLGAGLLAVVLWQWQQLGQAVVLLTRPDRALEAPKAPTGASIANAAAPPPVRLSLGLPLLTLAPLSMASPSPTSEAPASGDAAAAVAVKPEQPSVEEQSQ